MFLLFVRSCNAQLEIGGCTESFYEVVWPKISSSVTLDIEIYYLGYRVQISGAAARLITRTVYQLLLAIITYVL